MKHLKQTRFVFLVLLPLDLSKNIKINMHKESIFIIYWINKVTQLCPTLCDPMDCSLSGFYVHGILQARILEWVAIFFSRESSQPRYRTQVSCISSRFFTSWATREALHIRWNALNLMLFPVFFPLSSVLGIYPYCLLTCTCLLFTATCSICMHPRHLI